MRSLIVLVFCVLFYPIAYSQKTKVPAKNYPSLLWEITGNGLSKPSYLFGTMHVSNKLAFHLSDSFYLGIKNADVVALETDMGTWQDDFSRYEFMARGYNFDYNYLRRGFDGPGDYLTIGTLQFTPYDKLIERALYSSPAMINSFLYRTNSDQTVEFEEDTYLDMHIYQAGKKWGKKVCGVENFDRSMELMKEAYLDAERERNKKLRNYDFDEEFSYSKLEDAYRSGNLDLLDTINKVNSTSSAFDEKFLYRRNEIQANSIDSIIKTKQSLFVGVGAAHLPGQRGVIELLRKQGYRLRPIRMVERDSRHKDEVERLRVPVKFMKQTSADGLFSVSMPGKLYDFNSAYGIVDQQQFADMSNGAYYMVTRINTNSIMWGHGEAIVLRKIDSVIYENIPGKILSKQVITRNGYRGYEITNRTRRGDFQRYNIYVTPFEIIMFKMSGNSDYVKEGAEADQFFNSIQFTDYRNEWKKWTPPFGGFEVQFPHQPFIAKNANWQFMAIDQPTGTGFQVIRTDVHNYDFVEEDSFDLNLMEESFASSDFIDRQLTRKQFNKDGYSALESKYRYKDGSIALVTFLIQGTHYYTLIAHAASENTRMRQFLNSFRIVPFNYAQSRSLTDTTFFFTVNSAVPLSKPRKLSMYPEFQRQGYGTDDEERALIENGTTKNKAIANDSTGEKIFLFFNKTSRYHYKEEKHSRFDSTYFQRNGMKWTFRHKKEYELPGKIKVYEYVVGDPKSSRYIQGKMFIRNGVSHWMETQGDTLTAQSPFISEFFASFRPIDTIKGTNPSEKKAKLFFQDFFSSDTLLHKKALLNVSRLEFDSADFPLLKKCIQSLTWKEKKYMDVKNDFVWQLSTIKSKESSGFLKEIYFAAGDTVELQYTVLNALLRQKTLYSYQTFRDILVTEPPVLDVDNHDGSRYNPGRGKSRSIWESAEMYALGANNSDFNEHYRNQYFFDALTDSLELTATIFKDLLPLINIDDYEQGIMDLAGTLIDSNLIGARDYENYLTKFLIEARQLLKKQIISDKNKSIEAAQKADEDLANIYNHTIKNEDHGNGELSLYATLLMPFWEKNTGVQQFMNQLLKTDDSRLKYNTMIVLLKNGKPVADSLINHFASRDEYRYELYNDLVSLRLLNKFPPRFNNQVQLAKSKLFDASNSYNKPDSAVYLDKLPVMFSRRKGYVYFFKYRNKKDDNTWKLASVGIIPADPGRIDFDDKNQSFWEVRDYDFTELSNNRLEPGEPVADQLKKQLKKLQYSKRKSATQFYRNDGRMKVDYPEF